MGPERRRSGLRRVLTTILWALGIAFGVGFLIGSLLRRELDRPVRYIGAVSSDGREEPSTLATHPGDIGHALPRVLVPRDHEEQV